MGKGGLILCFAALSGCGGGEAARTPARVATGPAPAIVADAAANPPVGSRLPTLDTDICKAGELQWLVGRPRSEIPVPVDVINRRVACTTCPVTEDYSPYRLNIFYDQQTGLVTEVRCG
ncbi:MAG: hypothetical protein ACK4Z5_01900 [Brevundimonas sp.]